MKLVLLLLYLILCVVFQTDGQERFECFHVLLEVTAQN